jgi:hypothetical protein
MKPPFGTIGNRRLRGRALSRGSTRSNAPCELFFDFLHQRVGKALFAEIGEVIEDDGRPGLSSWTFLLVAISAIEGPRPIGAAQQHERVGAIGVDPNHFRLEVDGQVRCFKCLGEIAGEDEVVRQAADPCDEGLEIAFAIGISRVGFGDAVGNGEALAIRFERFRQIVLIG